MNFSNKTILITGAANGIGKKIAESFAKLKGTVIIADIDKEEGIKLERLLKKDSCLAKFMYFDVSDLQNIGTIIKKIIEEFNKIDILVNNAGICPLNTFENVNINEWNEVLTVNLSGAFFLTREASKYMISKRFGKIINISSISTKMGGVNIGPHYVASKGGLESLTRYFAKNLAKYHINVNAVSGSITDTNITKSWDKEVVKKIIEMTPLYRIGNVSDISKAVLFLASDDSSFITGEVLNVNGGFYMD